MLLPGVKAREMADWLTPIRAASCREVSGRFPSPVRDASRPSPVAVLVL